MPKLRQEIASVIESRHGHNGQTRRQKLKQNKNSTKAQIFVNWKYCAAAKLYRSRFASEMQMPEVIASGLVNTLSAFSRVKERVTELKKRATNVNNFDNPPKRATL